MWRIGNENKVSMWIDKWAPKLTIYAIQTPRASLPRFMKVNALIDFDCRRRKIEPVKENFDPTNITTVL